jgi:amino acid adenylation domain-containing protein
MSAQQALLQDSLVHAAERHGSAVALAAAGVRCTYGELLDRSLRLARSLQDLGVERGDRVAIVMPNSVACGTAIFGSLLAGGVFVVVNPETKTDRLATILAHSGATCVIGDGALRETVEGAAGHAPSVRTVVLETDTQPALSLVELISRSPAAPATVGTAPSDLAGLIYTSGTTGEPKGVMMTHANLVYLAGTITQYLRMDAEDRILSVLPLSHTYGLSQLIAATRIGAALHLETSFVYLAQATRLIQSESITTFPGVPTVFALLLSIHARTPLRFESVRRVTCAGGALLPSFLEGLGEVFPNALVFPMYGLTECMRACYLEPELVASRPSSVGRAISGSKALVLDAEGNPVRPGEPGVLHVVGPHVMPGYWKDPELTAQMLKDGPAPGETMLRTGDTFRVDEDGFLYFVGRSDEIIKTRGEKVSPVEVESVLHGIRGIREAAVIGVPDELLGEAIRAYVVLEEGASLSQRDVIAECRERLEGFKVPKEVVTLPELPKTPTGKIRKAGLIESVSSG